MKPLLDRIRIGDIVQGKMTKQVYEVSWVRTEGEYGDNTVCLINVVTDKALFYTRPQFNHHFRKVKS